MNVGASQWHRAERHTRLCCNCWKEDSKDEESVSRHSRRCVGCKDGATLEDCVGAIDGECAELCFDVFNVAAVAEKEGGEDTDRMRFSPIDFICATT